MQPVPTFESVREAAVRIAAHAIRTPALRSRDNDQKFSAEIHARFVFRRGYAVFLLRNRQGTGSDW
jgi:hypothetical protein